MPIYKRRSDKIHVFVCVCVTWQKRQTLNWRRMKRAPQERRTSLMTLRPRKSSPATTGAPAGPSVGRGGCGKWGGGARIQIPSRTQLVDGSSQGGRAPKEPSLSFRGRRSQEGESGERHWRASGTEPRRPCTHPQSTKPRIRWD